MNVFIFTNGDYKDKDFYLNLIDFNNGYSKGKRFLIAVDGGAKLLYQWNLVPDLIIGDLDSMPQNIYTFFKQKGVEFKVYPADKDYIDSQLAIQEAVNLNPSAVMMIAGLGSRLDQNLANLSLLYYAHNKGLNLKIINECFEVFILDKGINSFRANKGEKISILPVFSDIAFERSFGLKWALDGITLKYGNPIGVSNEAIMSNISIYVKSGVGFVFRIFKEW